MVKQEIKDRANSNRGFCRVVNLCDSRVVVGAFGKGRSSSRNLNHKPPSLALNCRYSPGQSLGT